MIARTRLLPRLAQLTLLLTAGLGAGIPAVATSATVDAEPRIRIIEGYDDTASVTTDAEARSLPRSASRHGYSHWPPEIWIADIGMSLFGDRDHDGYFSGFVVSIDADIDYGQAEVYASLYLAQDDETLQPFHTSAVFSLYERSGVDRYRIEAQLLDAFDAGHYDLLIDLHDAHTGHIVDTVSAVTFRNLNDLPLESDDYAPPTTTASLTITEYGGKSGPLALSTLLLFWWARRRARD